MCKETINRQFGVYERFFELQEEYVSRGVNTHAMNIRIPQKMNDLIESEIEEIKNRIGVRISKNDFMLLMLMSALNYNQHEENSKHIYKQSNKANLSNFIDEYEEKLIGRVKELLYMQEMDILLKKNVKHKTKTQQIRRLRKNLPEKYR